MESNFVKADSRNSPKVDAIIVGSFFKNNTDFYSAELRNVITAMVTIVKCKETRRSKGVAFVQFVNVDAACKCVSAMNNKEVYGRIIKCSIAIDNGRTSEFIKKKLYPNKSSCYECGDAGHLSYFCPKNYLGARTPPVKVEKKKFKKKRKLSTTVEQELDVEESDSGSEPPMDFETLSYAIEAEHKKVRGSDAQESSGSHSNRKVFKRSSYFSDEEYLSE